MKQTAVQWLVEHFDTFEFMYCDRNRIIKHAKELEKEQIEDAFCEGVDDEYEHHINDTIRKNSEQYYNETFKQL